jgi:hypothetical protein
MVQLGCCRTKMRCSLCRNGDLSAKTAFQLFEQGHRFEVKCRRYRAMPRAAQEERLAFSFGWVAGGGTLPTSDDEAAV